LRGEVPRIREKGAELVLVGCGRPEQAADFRDERGLDFPLFVDPELVAYRTAGLRRGLASSLSPKVLAHGLRALRGGHFQGATQGDPWQQGGAFVITPDDRVHYTHVSQEAGDHPDPEALLGALDRALARSGRGAAD
jgi:hypothetical protein